MDSIIPSEKICSSNAPDLPPGFRFHPTDEELITHYLRNQALSMACPVPIIPEINIYTFDPWELPGRSENAEEERYFFSPRDRKYPNGARPNRATTSGYWKATGTDKAIYNKNKYVGVKKALVFYKGRPPKGLKTGWVMHEYRLATSTPSKKSNGSMRLDDWVLCRIYEKKSPKQSALDDVGTPEPEVQEGVGGGQSPVRFPRSCSLAHLLEEEYMSISDMLNDYPLGGGDDFHAIASGGFGDAGRSGGLGWDLDGANKGKQSFSSMLSNQQAPSVVDQQQPIFLGF